MIKLKLISTKILTIISAPLILSGFFLDIAFIDRKLLAETTLSPANAEDLALYEGMGVTYVCIATGKKIKFKFEKALSVAASTFVNVIQAKHGGAIEENGEEIKVDLNRLYNNASFRILGGAINACSENVPKKSKKLFEKELERIQKEFEAIQNQNNQ